jgi:SDR family mycofactocin-dependent oxidoreductase
MNGRVEGKVAVITGAARGQGRSHAIRLAEEGADIIALDACSDFPAIKYEMATEEDLAQTQKEVEALGRRVVTGKVDVRDAAGLKTAIDSGVDELGRLDVVVANAGVCTWQNWDETSAEAWQEVLDINLTGVWNTMVAGAPHLIEAGGGSIVATSSTAGLKGTPFLGPYVAAKHGVVGIVNMLANELAKHHIRVNTVHPTGVNTKFVTAGMGDMNFLIERDPNLGPLFVNSLPVELLEPRDISNAVLYLASDESSYVTGLQLKVDAGNCNR